jgi:hypothetical protein
MYLKHFSVTAKLISSEDATPQVKGRTELLS